MAKVTRVSGRGTKRRTTDTSKKPKFAGDSYKEYQDTKVKEAGNRTVTTGRGTGKRKLSSATTKSASAKGRTRVTSRGTGSRKGTS
tara:strand:- start:1379 stop:1636 length:258 start_codon:yes stop_codon:yes gene_type:complete